jgi:tRNA (guanine9-N1)-methyltransferase
MAHPEERPLKIRKLDSASENDQVIDLAPSADMGLRNDSAERISPAIVEDDTVPLVINSNDAAHETIPAMRLSKNQLKKQLKKQKWEEGREYRKAKNKQKKKEKKIRKAEERAIVNLESTVGAPRAVASPKESHFRSIQLPITFVLDCDFDDLMTEAEIISLGSQMTRSYSDNRHAPYQAHLVISSFGGKLKHRFETVLAKNHLGWKGVKFTAEDFVAAAKDADSMMWNSSGGRLVGPFADAEYPSTSQERSLRTGTAKSESYNMTPPRDPVPSETVAATEGVLSHDGHTAADDLVPASTEETHSPNSASKTEESGLIDDATKEPSANANDQDTTSSHKPSIMYLTSDSPHTLDALLPYTTYIIGGIVDKNRHKGICYKRAMERNIPTAKLPIGEYMSMQSRSVLATNHVVEIMVKWLEYKDWAKAFLQVIPKRKEARLKVNMVTSGDKQNEDDDNDSSGSPEDDTFERSGDQG